MRESLGLVGTKFGCGAGLCGACTVLVDGQAQRSCLLRATPRPSAQQVEAALSGHLCRCGPDTPCAGPVRTVPAPHGDGPAQSKMPG